MGGDIRVVLGQPLHDTRKLIIAQNGRRADTYHLPNQPKAKELKGKHADEMDVELGLCRPWDRVLTKRFPSARFSLKPHFVQISRRMVECEQELLVAP